MRIVLVGAELEENLAIRYLWGTLAAEGHEVVSVAFNEAADTERAAGLIASSGARIAGYSMVFTARAREFARLIARARERGFGGLQVAGGHFAAFNAEALLRDVPALDAVALGEGETILRALAGRPDALPEVGGLVWRDAAGGIARNAPVPNPADLDDLTWPVRLRPFERYLGLPIVNMIGSRGCAHACDFCSIAAWHRMGGGARLRMRDPGRIAEEMAALYREGVRIFNFHDDHFLLGDAAATRSRAEAIRRELDCRGVGRIGFAIKARPDRVERPLFAYLKSIGLFRVFLGIEAGTAEALRRLGRGQTPGQNDTALRVVNDLDLHACFNLLLFNPDSTLEDVAANVAFLKAHPGNPMAFCRTEVYAGTPLEARMRREGRLLGDYWGWDYRIADPRVQDLFEIAYAAFRDRNYGPQAVHRLAMEIDFEHQVLAHFYGTSHALRRRVKAFIRRVNLDGVRCLDEAIGAVEPGLPETRREEVARWLTDRVESANPGFYREAEDLLYEIRRRADAIRAGRSTRAAWSARAAAAAGLLAALAGTLPGAVEAEPPPPQEQPPGDATPPADSAVLRNEFLGGAGGLVLMLVALPFTGKVRVDVTIDGEGKIRRAVVESDALEAPVKESVGKLLGRLYVRTPEAAGKRFVLELTSVEIQAVRAAHWAVPPRPDAKVLLPPPVPALDPPRGKAPKEGDLDDVRGALVERVLGPAALVLYPRAGVEMELWFDERGRVRYADAVSDRLQESSKRVLLRLVRSTYVETAAAYDRRFRVVFTRDEVDQTRASIRRSPTHMCEYAPRRADGR